MKRFLLFLATGLLTTFSAQAQVQPFENGFYRAENTGSHGWIFVYDNYSSGVIGTSTSYDVSALSSFKSFKNIVSNYGSVVYVMKEGTGYNLYAQGTDVMSFTNGLVIYLREKGNTGTYRMYSKYKGAEASLYDMETSKEEGQISTTGTDGFQYWRIVPVSAESDNYLGITPSLEHDGSYYKSFYASFATTFASSGMSAFYVKRITDDGAAIIAPIEDKVPACTPVIVKCASASYEGNRINPLFESDGNPADNQLKGVYFSHIFDRLGLVQYKTSGHLVYTAFDPNTMRVLGKTADGRLGLVNSTSAPSVISFNDSDNNPKMALTANSCYVTVAAGTNAELPLLTEDEYPAWQELMSVQSIKAGATEGRTGVYTLSGQQLNVTGNTDGLRPGVYVVNGQKQLVR